MTSPSDTIVPMDENITRYLDALKRDECYRVDSVLKENGADITQKVYFVGANGSEHGPYIRKYLGCLKGNGHEYERILDVQSSGTRFLHIPRIFDWYAIDDSTVVVISEYVDGQTLEQVVSDQGGSVLLAEALFDSICESVLELHCKFNPPMIHRDLKPSNIIIKNGNVNIIDFGIARSYKVGVSSDTNHFGTREYAPPEQFGFGQTDRRSDVYALGLILYYILTARTPDAQARQQGYASPNIPEELRLLIVRATMIDPKERFEDVSMFRKTFLETMASLKQRWNETACGISSNVSSASALELHTKSNSLLSGIPKALGLTWDIILALLLVLMMAAGVGSTFYPIDGTDLNSAALPVRAVAYFGMVFLMFPAMAYLICDRRPLRKLKFFENMHAKHIDIAIASAMLVIGFLMVGISGMFY